MPDWVLYPTASLVGLLAFEFVVFKTFKLARYGYLAGQQAFERDRTKRKI